MNVNQDTGAVNQTMIASNDPMLEALEKRLSSMIVMRFMMGVVVFWLSSGLDKYGWYSFSRMVAVLGIAIASWGLIGFFRLMLDKRHLANHSHVAWSDIPAFAAMRRRCGW